MKLSQSLRAITIVCGLALAGEAKAGTVYDVNLALGAGGIIGSITTDGHSGVIGASDILAWNLIGTGNGGSTIHVVNGSSNFDLGNNTAVFNPTVGTPDLTADSQHIYFNFSATDGGYLGFQNGSLYGGQTYVSFGANFNSDVAQGTSVVPGDTYNESSTINVPESGNQIIATVVPEPATLGWAGLGGVLLLSLCRRPSRCRPAQ